jgi:hypothetical protein
MSSPNLKLRTLTSALLAAGMLTVGSPVPAKNSYLKTWQNLYPGSTTDNASCSVCHGTGNTNLNAYGKDLCVAFGGSVPANIVPALQAIEEGDSDQNPTMSTNSQEIAANAQPGWTEGPLNQIYAVNVGGGCPALGSPISVPSTVPLPYDPPAEGMPVADPNGPYAGNVDVPITFDGSGSYDSDNDGPGIVSYAWNFGDGLVGEGMTPSHAYTEAGTYTVTLTVTDDEGKTDTNSTVATISGDAVLDLDIAALNVTGSVRLGKPIAIALSVDNPGTVTGQAFATVVGTLNGSRVYEWTLNVYDNNTKGSTSFTFPTYTPKAKGTINWAATIADVDPDPDLATATTVVK